MDIQPLRNSSSYEVLRYAVAAGGPSPLALLNLTHEGRVLSDGAAKGVIGLASSLVGLPVDAYDFVANRLGDKPPLSSSPSPMSSAWVEGKITKIYNALQEIDPRGKVQVKTTADEMLQGAGYWGVTAGSFLIPAAGWSSAASKLGVAGRAAEYVGTLGNVYNKAATGVAVIMGTTLGFEYGNEPERNGPYDKKSEEQAAAERTKRIADYAKNHPPPSLSK